MKQMDRKTSFFSHAISVEIISRNKKFIYADTDVYTLMMAHKNTHTDSHIYAGKNDSTTEYRIYFFNSFICKI